MFENPGNIDFNDLKEKNLNSEAIIGNYAIFNTFSKSWNNFSSNVLSQVSSFIFKGIAYSGYSIALEILKDHDIEKIKLDTLELYPGESNESVKITKVQVEQFFESIKYIKDITY
jgi:hypothetical protein